MGECLNLLFQKSATMTRVKHEEWVVEALAGVACLVGASSHALKGRGFHSPSGHMPRLWIQSPVGVLQEAADQCFSHRCLFPPSPTSLLNINK